jgi:hypothetical protein
MSEGEDPLAALAAANKHVKRLDPQRIRRLAASRRAANRMRAYKVIGAIVLIAIVAQIVWSCWR